MSDKVRCPNRAYCKFTWPGKDQAFICYPCSLKLKAVANAIDLHIQYIFISQKDLENKEQCEQKVKIS